MKTSTCLTILAILLTCTAGLHAASTIQFSANSYTVAGSAGTVVLTVQRTNDLNTLVNVDYDTAD